MTKKELLEKIQSLPGDDNMEVFIHQYNDEYPNAGVNTIEIQPIVFGAPDIPKKEWPTIDCIVITDEF